MSDGGSTTVTTKTRAWLWVLLPFIVTLLLYLPASFHAGWVVDDRPLIPDHLHPGDILGEWLVPTHAHAANRPGYLWRPLTSSLYQVWGGLFGRTPTPFRLLNLLLQLLNLGLVLVVARKVGAGLAIAGLVATAWAVHPLLPDAVCWMADTYDLLATTWLLAGLALTLSTGLSLWTRAAGAALTFALALLSKEASLSWLAALPLILLLLRGLRPAIAVGLSLAPVAALHSAWHGAVVGHFQTSALDLLRRGWPDFLGLWTDFARWPLTLPVRSGFTHLVQPGGEPIVWAGVGVLVIGLLGLIHGLRSANKEGLRLVAAVACWLIMISPGALAALSFGQQSSRYLYVGLTLSTPLLAGALAALESGPARRQLGLLVVAVATWAAVWLPVTHARIQAWSSETSLFAQELDQEPANSFALKGYGRLLVGQGRTIEGLRLWHRALQTPPPSTFVMDVQVERLDFAQVAAAAGQPALALDQLDAFITGEHAAARTVDPSVETFRRSLLARTSPEHVQP